MTRKHAGNRNRLVASAARGGVKAMQPKQRAKHCATDSSARGLQRIVSIAMRENVASTHIMEKLGMKYERETAHRGFAVVMYAVANPKLANA